MGATLSPAWLRALQAQAAEMPRQRRDKLWAGTACIGSVEPGYMQALHLASLTHAVVPGAGGWQVQGDFTASLRDLALAMRAAGLAGPWRNELLAVCDDRGDRLAVVERGAVRPLGIRTQAVHLIGQTPDGAFWMQRRALSKPNNPGMLDTLMGGMVSAEDSLAQALARETWEEAGLHLPQLQALTWGGTCTIARPSAEGTGAGYMQEQLHWWRCVVPEGLEPVNQDGEVERFERLPRPEVLRLLQEQTFTLEASLVLAAALQA